MILLMGPMTARSRCNVHSVTLSRIVFRAPRLACWLDVELRSFFFFGPFSVLIVRTETVACEPLAAPTAECTVSREIDPCSVGEGCCFFVCAFENAAEPELFLFQTAK